VLAKTVSDIFPTNSDRVRGIEMNQHQLQIFALIFIFFNVPGIAQAEPTTGLGGGTSETSFEQISASENCNSHNQKTQILKQDTGIYYE
jgi:hypothetical protein